MTVMCSEVCGRLTGTFEDIIFECLGRGKDDAPVLRAP